VQCLDDQLEVVSRPVGRTALWPGHLGFHA